MGLYPFTAYNIYDLPGLVNILEWQKKQHTQIEQPSPVQPLPGIPSGHNPRNNPGTIEKRTGAGAPRLPCAKGAGKILLFLTEGL